VAAPSILLVARVHGTVGGAGALLRAARELARAAAARDGCVGFDVLEPGEPGELVILSGWRDEAAMRAHFASEAYAEYTAALTDLLARPSDVTVHRVSATVHPVADLAGEPGRVSFSD
jgi:quinol monooxygenase YgiN